jgi:hypothetical protein
MLSEHTQDSKSEWECSDRKGTILLAALRICYKRGVLGGHVGMHRGNRITLLGMPQQSDSQTDRIKGSDCVDVRRSVLCSKLTQSE